MQASRHAARSSTLSSAIVTMAECPAFGSDTNTSTARAGLPSGALSTQARLGTGM